MSLVKPGRRQFVTALAGVGLAAATGVSGATGRSALGGRSARARVVVVGGGFAGATAAKYLRMWSAGAIEVTLIEPNAAFVSCPLSNLVLGGSRQMASITTPYTALNTAHGVQVVRSQVTAMDASKRTVTITDGTQFSYDRLLLAPGIDFMWETLPAMQTRSAQDAVLHAWKAGPQTQQLRAQLEAMPEHGVCAISIPATPYRCPPAPYERACQIAHYMQQRGGKGRVIILDANEDVTSKGALFKQVWRERYANQIEYRPGFVTADVDLAGKAFVSEFGDRVSADVLNLIPAQRAGRLALQTGLANINARWCEVDFLSYESRVAQGVHILGDAIQGAPQMPKSAHMANQQAKVCAAAVIDLLNDRLPSRRPVLANTCYSFVSDSEAMHVSSVHTYDPDRLTMMPVIGAGGLSPAASALEGRYGMAWAQNIWADSLL